MGTEATPGGVAPPDRISPEERQAREAQLSADRGKQRGIAYPSPRLQKSLLIIRLNVATAHIDEPITQPDAELKASRKQVREGLLKLCGLFARIDKGEVKIDALGEDGFVTPRPLADFYFSATIGFGLGFFDRLHIPQSRRPPLISAMPDHQGLADPVPYSLGQTDLIIQLGAAEEYINRWVFENSSEPIRDGLPTDILSAIQGWAVITDVHAGFQRLDGRNLMGFFDGISNPARDSDLFKEVVWTTRGDGQPFETEANAEPIDLSNGTYMVFQKVVHDLSQWRRLEVRRQEEWVGRSKATGLLLGTLSPDADRLLAAQMWGTDPTTRPEDREAARQRWKELFSQQTDPRTRFYDTLNADQPLPGNIKSECPVWSHVRKANPRELDGHVPRRLMYRRGYLFIERGPEQTERSGLLFIAFQRDIETAFEFIKRSWLGNPNFPEPGTGREGLSGPSEGAKNLSGQFLAIVPLGGGYYFIPPVPNGDLAQIGQPFFASKPMSHE